MDEQSGASAYSLRDVVGDYRLTGLPNRNNAGRNESWYLWGQASDSRRDSDAQAAMLAQSNMMACGLLGVMRCSYTLEVYAATFPKFLTPPNYRSSVDAWALLPFSSQTHLFVSEPDPRLKSSLQTSGRWLLVLRTTELARCGLANRCLVT